MIRFDRYRRRFLQLLFLIALPQAFPPEGRTGWLFLFISCAAFLVCTVPDIGGIGERFPLWSRAAVSSELVLASFGAALLLFDPLLLFVPLSAARLASFFSGLTGWRKNALIVLPALVPLGAGIVTASPGLFLFLTAAVSAPAAVFFILQLIREQELRRLETEKSLQTKEAILSTLAHEIRTPLTVIQSTVDIMCEGRVGPLDRRQKQFLQSVGSNVRRLVTLSDTILASIKVESAWFTISLHPIDMRKVIKSVASHMQPVLEERNIEMRYSFPQLLSRPPADEGWIHQVLVNLVHNAVKHMRSGGRVIISVNENEDAVVVSVSDNGSGIRLNERTKVFNEFFQGDNWSDVQLEGAGLGLAIVKRVIEKHNGRVYVGSVEHVGTTVSFTLPLHEEKNDD
jgi:signal transduction histidine kinase